VAAAAVVSLLAAGTPALAQSSAGSADPHRLGFRAFATCDSLTMAATKTFEAVFDTSTLTACGGGVEVVNVWKQIFVHFERSTAKETGQRVFVSDGTAYPLGIPLKMTMTPRELSAGWRFGSGPKNRFVPYAGAGAVWLDYTETSDFASTDENVSAHYTGSAVFGGIDVALLRFLTAGAEVRYRTINVTGLTGAAKDFGEKNFGGGAVRVVIGFRY
jgi:hypothetical protein